MSADLDELRREYEKFQAMRQKAAEDNPAQHIGQLREQMTALTAAVTSPSGKVTVVAGQGGSIQDIQLTDEAMRLPAAALAAELKLTLQQAVAAAAREQASIVDQHMGGLNMYDQVLQNQAEAFGTTVDELKQLGQPAAAPPKPPRDDDDFSQNTFMAKRQTRSEPPPSRPSGGSAGDQFLKNLMDEEP